MRINRQAQHARIRPSVPRPYHPLTPYSHDTTTGNDAENACASMSPQHPVELGRILSTPLHESTTAVNLWIQESASYTLLITTPAERAANQTCRHDQLWGLVTTRLLATTADFVDNQCHPRHTPTASSRAWVDSGLRQAIKKENKEALSTKYFQHSLGTQSVETKLRTH